MLDFADRVLMSLAAILILIANELRLYQTRPEAPEGAFTSPNLIRLFDDSQLVYLSLPDILLRSVLAAAVIAFSGWVLTSSFRRKAR